MTGRRRTPGDWVYRGPTTDNEGAQNASLASYSHVFFSLGVGESTAHILYDSQNFLKGVAGNSEIMYQAARAAGRRPKTYRVRGQMHWQANVWSLGDELRFGMRIGVFKQDPLDGFMINDATYIMMSAGFGGAQGVDTWANSGRGNLWEHRNYQHFATGNESSQRMFYINTPARASLGPDECLALYIENGQGSESLRYGLWLSTYVSDESSG